MLLLTSCVIVVLGIGFGWTLYGNKSPNAEAPDALERAVPWIWAVLRDKFYVDEFYGATFIAFYEWWHALPTGSIAASGVARSAAVTWLFGLWAQ